MEIKYDPLFRMEIYSHFFKILNPNPRMQSLLLRFSAKYVLYEWERDNRGKKNLVPSKVFASRTKDGLEYRFHRGQYLEFMEMLRLNLIEPHLYDVEYIDMYKPVPIEIDAKPEWVMRDYQNEAIDFINKEYPNDDNSRLIMIPTGKGKAQPLDALIKIPNGWKLMGDIKLNDDVITIDGSISKVIGIYPQGVKPIYKITFSDGRSTECTEDHLWKVYSAYFNKYEKILTTRQLIFSNIKNGRYYIDLPESENNNDVNLPIDPYLLGVLLGNGCLRHNVVKFSTRDSDLVNEVSRLIPKDLKIKYLGKYDYIISKKNVFCRRNNSLKDELSNLNLYGKLSYNKFIPNIYLNSSTKQRLHLLQGLLDTDGYIDINSTISYSTSSYLLAQHVQYLVRSLGHIAKISLKYPKYTYKGEKKDGRISYIIRIRVKKQSNLFRVKRKHIRTNDNNQYSNNLKLRIDSIEFVGKKEAQCIMIDHPSHLYITNDFIVTHNTAVSLYCISKYRKFRVLVTVLPTYMEKWAADVPNITTVGNKRIMLVQGSPQLKGVIQAGKEKILDVDIIICSITTLQNFYKAYENDKDCLEEEGYDCHPEDLCKTLGIGTILIDETHQHIYSIFKMLLYTHVPKVIALSATFETLDPFMEKIQKIIFPHTARFDKIKMDKYIKAYAISYSYNDFRSRKIRWTEFGSNTYSHNAYEKSIMKDNNTLNNYLKMIEFIVRVGYIENYIDDDKLLIYASSIKMCTFITNYLKVKFPDKDVRRYVENDPYENVIDADIRITTLGSAGAAIDIPNLRMTLMTVNVTSITSNKQSIGRLRNLKDRDVKFYFIYCNDIKKQIDNYLYRKEIFDDRVESMKDLRYTNLL